MYSSRTQRCWLRQSDSILTLRFAIRFCFYPYICSVKSIAPGSLFEDTALKAGLRLVSVNGRTVSGLTAATATHLFSGAQYEITVTAEDPEVGGALDSPSTSSPPSNQPSSASSMTTSSKKKVSSPPGTRPGGVW